MNPQRIAKIAFNLALLGAVVVIGSRIIERVARKVPG